MNTPEKFRVAMRQSALVFDGEIIADGKLHRFKTTGDHARNSWYILHAGSHAAGAFGCWKRGVKETWCERNGNLSQTEWNEVRRRWQAAEREREQAEAERHAKARNTAAWILEHSKPVTAHGYLTAKGVRPHGGLRQRGDLLVLPLRDSAGELHSLQIIGADGTKRFLFGGCVTGCYFTVADVPDGPLVIAEGFATAASIAEGTGLATVAAMNAGNLLAVAKALRERFPSREIIIAADNDQFTDCNPGEAKAAEAAKTVRARLAVPQFKNTTTKPTDFNDLAQLEGLDIVKIQIETAATPTETDEETYVRLAKLSLADYDRCRDSEATRLEIRVSTLDNEVAKRRPKDPMADSDLQGRRMNLADVELWPEAVSGADVLADTAETFSRYVVLPKGAADVLALWTAHSHCFESFQCSPRLNISSPEKRCGKTTLRDVLAVLVPRPLPTENLSVAVLFRVVEKFKPTVMGDEADSWVYDSEELRGLLNAGHRRGGQALRCEGESNEVRAFNVFTPTVLCGIGSLPGTLHDRSIVIPLERAKPGELTKRFDSRWTTREQELCRKLARWCANNRARLEACDPVMPSGAFNRLADNWRPLFAIAEIAGGDWPQRAAAAFANLTAKSDVDAQGLGTMLLGDVWQIFRDSKAVRMFSKTLVESLLEMTDHPWPEAHHGKPITETWLARRLHTFGINSQPLRIADKRARGYELADFREAIDRYVPVEEVSKRDSVTTRADIEVSQFSKRDIETDCHVSEIHKTTANIDLSRCHASNPRAEAGELVL